jgi:hypothetical protein
LCCGATHLLSLALDTAAPDHAAQRALDFGRSHLLCNGNPAAVTPVHKLPLLLVYEFEARRLSGLPASFVALNDKNCVVQVHGWARVKDSRRRQALGVEILDKLLQEDLSRLELL